MLVELLPSVGTRALFELLPTTSTIWALLHRVRSSAQVELRPVVTGAWRRVTNFEGSANALYSMPMSSAFAKMGKLLQTKNI